MWDDVLVISPVVLVSRLLLWIWVCLCWFWIGFRAQNDSITDCDSGITYGTEGSSSNLFMGEDVNSGAIDEVAFWKDIEFVSESQANSFARTLYNSGNGMIYQCDRGQWEDPTASSRTF